MNVDFEKEKNIRALMVWIGNGIVSDIKMLAQSPKDLVIKKLSPYHLNPKDNYSKVYIETVKIEIIKEIENDFISIEDGYFYHLLIFLYGEAIAKDGSERLKPYVKKAKRNLHKFKVLLDKYVAERIRP